MINFRQFKKEFSKFKANFVELFAIQTDNMKLIRIPMNKNLSKVNYIEKLD